MRATTRLLFPLTLVASAQAAYYEVTVGKGGKLKFEPEILNAEVGDTIRYLFYSKNHSVVQSTFDDPCEPKAGGFFSGFVPAESKDTPARTAFTITVDNSDPKWVYCSQGNHCQTGMVHVINPPKTGKTLEGYKEAAAEIGQSESPPLPVNGLRRTTIDVGKDGKLAFEPNNIREPKGTVINFVFHPKNHSVVEAAFADPCRPLAEGFSSGFIPVASSPSNTVFEFDVEDDEPMYFYCAQGNHCQSGMVGAINAPTEDQTLEAFVAAAKDSKPPGSIPAQAPVGGIVMVNGTIIRSFNGSVLPSNLSPDTNPTPTDSQSNPISTNPPSSSQTLPPPSPDAPEYYSNRAGGGKPVNYNWAATLSPNATAYLQLHARIEDLLLHLLWEATKRLEEGGAWAGVYPRAIVDTIGAWAAQSLIHRATTAEVLSHYKQAVPGSCAYKLPLGSVDEFLAGLAQLNLVQIGALIDISAQVAQADPFVIPLLMTQVGAKSRAAGVVNMMQNHMASATPREVAVPAALAWGFVMGRFVDTCPDEISGMSGKGWPVLEVSGKTEQDARVVSIDLAYEGGSGEQFVAWLGPYGMLEFTKITEASGKKSAAVPAGWYGDVWIVVVSKSGIKLGELADNMVAGPQMVWITEP